MRNNRPTSNAVALEVPLSLEMLTTVCPISLRLLLLLLLLINCCIIIFSLLK